MEQLSRLGVEHDPEEEFWIGAGCDKCLGKGDEGRIGLFELLILDDEMRSELIKEIPTHMLHKLAMSQGMATLLDDGLAYVKEGDKIFSDPGGPEGLAVVPAGQEEATIESAEECPGECIFIEV